ncbi:hypothetical protein ACQJBY_056768 [Aegilops geniculata]
MNRRATSAQRDEQDQDASKRGSPKGASPRSLMGGASSPSPPSPPARLPPPRRRTAGRSPLTCGPQAAAGIKPGLRPSSRLAPAHNPDPEDPRFDCPLSRSTSTSSTSTGRWPPSCGVLGQGVAALAAPRGSGGALLLPSWWQLLSQYQQFRRLTNLQFLQTSAGRYCGKTMMTINLIKETKFTISFKSQHWLTEWNWSGLVPLKL